MSGDRLPEPKSFQDRLRARHTMSLVAQEELAEAIYEECCDPRLVVPWSEEHESIKEHWREIASKVRLRVLTEVAVGEVILRDC